MKKQIYMLACASVLVAGCSSEDDILQKPSLEPTPQETPETFSITASFDGVTRTHTDPTNHLKSLWTSSDKIYIGEASTMAEFTVSSLTNGGATAIFTGTTAFSEGSYAVYGGTTTAPAPSIDNGKVSGITVPNSWTYDKDNDCANVLLMGEVNTSSQTITFKHAGGVLYVDLGAYATSFKTIRVTSGNSTNNTTAVNISGAATITWDATNQYPTYKCEGSDSKTITISASETSFAEGTKIIVPVPAAIYGKLTVDACMVNGTEFDNQILSISDVTIERKKSYTVTYTGTPVTSVEDAATLISALSNTEGCNVKLSDKLKDHDNTLTLNSDEQTFTISGTNATVVDLNGKTLKAQKDNEGKVSLTLNVGSNTKTTSATPSTQNFVLKNGNVVIEEGTTETELTITNACNIYLQNINFTVPITSVDGTANTYKIILNIDNVLAPDTNDMIYFNYTNCTINGHTMDYPAFGLNTNYAGGKIAEREIDGKKIILQIEVNRTSGSSN